MTIQLKQSDLVKDYKVACMGTLGYDEIVREYVDLGTPDDYFVAEGYSHQDALVNALLDMEGAGYIVPDSLKAARLDDTVCCDSCGKDVLMSVLVVVKVR